jgi:hypothetical protein
MTVKEIEGRCWFPCTGLLLLSRNAFYLAVIVEHVE